MTVACLWQLDRSAVQATVCKQAYKDSVYLLALSVMCKIRFHIILHIRTAGLFVAVRLFERQSLSATKRPEEFSSGMSLSAPVGSSPVHGKTK